MFHLTISSQDIDNLLRLFMAAVLSGVIGFERETHGKDAGVRTYALVGIGSALVMLVSTEIYEIYKGVADVDPSRIAAQVVSGIGFLGAGAIIRFPQGVKGLTTAAGIWTAAGIGLACGIGQYRPAVITTVLVLIVLIIFSKIDRIFLGGKDS